LQKTFSKCPLSFKINEIRELEKEDFLELKCG
jgi:hypothetical protein